MQHHTSIVVTNHDDIQVIYPPGTDFVVIRVRYGKARGENSSSDSGIFELIVARETAEQVFDTAHKLAVETPRIVPVEQPLIIPGA